MLETMLVAQQQHEIIPLHPLTHSRRSFIFQLASKAK
jgi:hypothetical protein